MVLDFLAVDNFDFTRKIVKKNLAEKLVKILVFLSKLNLWTKNLVLTQCVILQASDNLPHPLAGRIRSPFQNRLRLQYCIFLDHIHASLDFDGFLLRTNGSLFMG